MNLQKYVWLVATFLVAFVTPRAIFAQAAPPVSLSKNGVISWTGAYTNGLLAIERSTSLASNSWIPYQSYIVTNASGSLSVPLTNNPVFYRVIRADSAAAPAGMRPIPGGSFQMGDYWNWPFTPTNQRPLHDASVSSFYIDQFEVTFTQMRDVLQWAYDHNLVMVTNRNNNGNAVWNLEGTTNLLVYLQGSIYKSNFIAFANGQFTVSPGWTNYGCTAVTWYGAAAYGNYKSDMEGLQRCVNFTNWTCDLSRNGYRLPSEAEFEKASRGGMSYNHYPWPSYGTFQYWNFITTNNANYTPVGQTHSFTPTPVGSYPPNGYGLYDMAGNMREWCWDWYDPGWYSQPGATAPDPSGPATGFYRIIRGGGFESDEQYSLCAFRDYEDPTVAFWYHGFRTVRRAQ
jgi:formylglycine-generating enzyme required for sulfatase activity